MIKPPTKLSTKGATFIANFEGYRADWYRDPVGVATIGYGHTGPLPAGFRAPLSRAEALRLLQHDAQGFANAVAAIRPRIRKQTRFDAIVSFAYNLGAGTLGPEHTIGQALRKRARVQAVAEALMLYDQAGGHVLPGLRTRRYAERKLWLMGRY